MNNSNSDAWLLKMQYEIPVTGGGINSPLFLITEKLTLTT